MDRVRFGWAKEPCLKRLLHRTGKREIVRLLPGVSQYDNRHIALWKVIQQAILSDVVIAANKYPLTADLRRYYEPAQRRFPFLNVGNW